MGNHLKTIGVFLSSHEHIDAVYAEAVDAVGRWIGQHGLTLVYGGSRSGMMERLACAVKQSGGKVMGVVPDVVRQRGLESAQCDVIMYAADLTDRKAIMMREADVILALPGGIGTLDEMFTAAAADVIGTASKKCMHLTSTTFGTPSGKRSNRCSARAFSAPTPCSGWFASIHWRNSSNRC